jgi:hypothetical protein
MKPRRLATRNTEAMIKLENPLSFGCIWEATTKIPTREGNMPPIACPAMTEPMYLAGKVPAMPNMLPCNNAWIYFYEESIKLVIRDLPGRWPSHSL